MPGDRARLHAMALEAIEGMFGGRPSEPPPLEPRPLPFSPHPTDPLAEELAEHARLARGVPGAEEGGWNSARRTYLRRAAAHAGKNYRQAEAARLWMRLAEDAKGVERGGALLYAAVALDLGEEAEEAGRSYHLALAELRATGDRLWEATALGNLALLLQQTGKFAEAEQACRQAMAIFCDIGDRRAWSIALGNLANQFLDTGRVAEAEKTFEEAIAIHRDVGDRR